MCIGAEAGFFTQIKLQILRGRFRGHVTVSLFGTMRTGVSGMNAQANRLSAVADNIANSSTTGYKKASTEFSSLLLPSSVSSYNSGSVQTQTRYSISAQGSLNSTVSVTDLAIDGSGFFIVHDASGTPYLTRAGSFVPDQNGNLVNAAGYTLLGYDYPASPVTNGLAGLVPVNLNVRSLAATPTTQGTLAVNLPYDVPVGYTRSTSLIAYDSLGNERLLEIRYTMSEYNVYGVDVLYEGQSILDRPATPTTESRVGGNNYIYDTDQSLAHPQVTYDDAGNERILRYTFTELSANKWRVDILEQDGWNNLGSMELDFDDAGRLISNPTLVTSPFSYPDGTIVPITIDFSDMVRSTEFGGYVRSNGNAAGPDFPIEFDPHGQPVDHVSQERLAHVELTTKAITIGGAQFGPISIDLSGTTQLAAEYVVQTARMNGSAASKVAGYSIGDDGVVYARFENGSFQPLYQIALADVPSPDLLDPVSGNVFQQTAKSGNIRFGFAGSSGYGSIRSGALESSNVDIAEELTTMIEAQRNYTANSKVFQTGSELMDVLVNLKR